MKQTTKTLVGLLVLLLVAGGIASVALWAGKDAQKKAEAKEKSEKLFDFDKAHARELRLSKDGHPVARLVKGEKSWKLVQPVEAEADDTAVDSLLSSLSGLKQKKDLPDEKDLKSFGLDQPKLEVAVKLDDGKEQGVQIGTDNSFDNTLYAKKLGDSTVRVIDAYQKTALEKTAFDLRDKKVAHLDDAAELKRIDVAGVKSPYVLEKDGTTWKVNGAAADAGAADRVASALKSLRATAVAAEKAGSLKEFGLDKPKATVKLAVAAGSDTYARVVRIGQVKSGAAQKTYAKREDSATVYEVDKQGLTVRSPEQGAGQGGPRGCPQARVPDSRWQGGDHAGEEYAARRRVAGRGLHGGRSAPGSGEEVEDLVCPLLHSVAARGGVRGAGARREGPRQVRPRQAQDGHPAGRGRQGAGSGPRRQ